MNLYERVLDACTERNADVAIVAEIELAPVEGFDCNKIMPPTYAKAKGEGSTYHIENRLVTSRHENGDNGDKSQKLVVLDAVQSCANHCETAARKYLPFLADLLVEVKTLNKILSSTEMPHRIFDAALRDCKINGVEFCDTPLGKAVYGTDERVALRAVYEHNPLAVLLGGWCSHVGPGHRLKMPRILKSEIIAGLVSQTSKSSSRICPLEIEDNTYVDHQPKVAGHPWEIGEETPKKAEKGKGKKDKGAWEQDPKKRRPSEIGHGNIPPGINSDVGGVSVSWIKDKFSLSITRTFRYCTGNEKEDRLVRANLVCLGMYLFMLKAESYGDLRSGCELSRLDPVTRFAFVNYGKRDELVLSLDQARDLYLQSLKPLEGAFNFRKQTFDAQEKLEQLVRNSLSPSASSTTSVS